MAADDLFKTAPRAVIDYFDRRPSVPTFRWTDFAPREHALAFTVAKSAGFNVVDDIRAAMRQAIVDQLPFETFRDGLTPVLQDKGWWGRKIVTGPNGEKELAELGSPRRLKIIYDANIASAHAAGEWARIQETKDFLPYLRYEVSISERKRPEHLSWVGTTLPADDPWWRTHFPPNGWNCKCRTEQISAPEAGRAPKDKRQAPVIDYRDWRNRSTGKTEQVPAGIDPGWQHNPGLLRDRTLSQQLAKALDRLDHAERSAAIEALRAHPVFDYVVSNRAGFDHARRLDPRQAAAGRFFAAVASAPEAVAALLGAETRTVALSVADSAKQQAKRGLGLADYALVQIILDSPDELYIDRGGKLVAVKVIDGKPWRAVVKLTSQGELLLNSFRREADAAKPNQLRD